MKSGLKASPVVARLKNPIWLSSGINNKEEEKGSENPSRKLMVAQSLAHPAAYFSETSENVPIFIGSQNPPLAMMKV